MRNRGSVEEQAQAAALEVSLMQSLAALEERMSESARMLNSVPSDDLPDGWPDEGHEEVILAEILPPEEEVPQEMTFAGASGGDDDVYEMLAYGPARGALPDRPADDDEADGADMDGGDAGAYVGDAARWEPAAAPRHRGGAWIALVPFSLIALGAATMIVLRGTAPPGEAVQMAAAGSLAPRIEAAAVEPQSVVKLDESRLPEEPLGAAATSQDRFTDRYDGEAAGPAPGAGATADIALRQGSEPEAYPAAARPDDPEGATAARGAEADDGALAYFPERPRPPSGADRAIAPRGAIDLSSARQVVVARDVNLRAGPENGSRVLSVVRNGTRLAAVGCTIWCEVVVDGRRGWIFPSFLKNPDGSPVQRF